MAKLTVTKYEPQANWPIPCMVKVEIEAVAVRASRMQGAGSATISYEAQDADGQWFNFLKKDNPGVKLSTAHQLKWQSRRLVDVRGMRGVYKFVSEPHELNPSTPAEPVAA